jgi:hypothetical protein
MHENSENEPYTRNAIPCLNRRQCHAYRRSSLRALPTNALDCLLGGRAILSDAVHNLFESSALSTNHSCQKSGSTGSRNGVEDSHSSE